MCLRFRNEANKFRSRNPRAHEAGAPLPVKVSVDTFVSRSSGEVEDLARGLQTVEHNLCGILYSGVVSRILISQKRKDRLTLEGGVLPRIT